MEKTIAQKFAEVVQETKFDNLPPYAVEHAKKLTLDVLGSMIGTRKVITSKIAREISEELGGPEEATIVGSGLKVNAPNAAFANAIQCYGLDFVDDHNESNSHPSPATYPASLAISEHLHKSGKEFIEAVVLGNEMVTRMGSAYLGEMYYQGFHPTSTCGTMGVAVSASKLYGLDVDTTVNALGIAGSMVSGLMAWNSTGAFSKRLQAGHPAMNSIIAARMAAKGFTGPSDIFEGKDGLLHAYSYRDKYDAESITDGLGETWTFAGSSIKVYPCCRYSGGHIDACLEIVNKYSPNPEEIEKVEVRSSKYTMRLLAEKEKWQPRNIVDLQFSMPYQAAIAFKNGKVTVAEFDEKYIDDPLIKRLIAATTVVMDEEFERRYPEHYSSAVTITMKDGTEYTAVIDDPKGDKRNPVTYEEVVEKFRNLATPIFKDAELVDKIITYINDLENQTDIADLVSLIK
ncbi:MmgE/PrpD family protein [Bacillota bacterium]